MGAQPRPARGAARAARALFVAALCLAPPIGAETALRALTAPLPGALAALDDAAHDLCAPGPPPAQGVVAVLADERRLRVSLEGSRIRLAPAAPCTAAPRTLPADLLPGTLPQPGAGAIAEAWLAAPTLRYRHPIFVRPENAARLVARLADGRTLAYAPPADAVIEDRRPRVLRLGASDAILTVQSTAGAGAAVLLVGPGADRLEVLAESAPIGTPSRWLNPIGVADFDGDGVPEIAVVVTPHIGGILTLYRREAARLVAVARRPGFSNHAIGSDELRLAAVLDADGDGVADIALPDASRRALVVVSFAGGRFRELARFEHAAPPASAVLAADLDGDGRPEVAYALADGTLVVLTRRR